MSRYLRACVTALIIGFASTSGISAQDRDSSAPVDIRPPASRLRTPLRSTQHSAFKVHAAPGVGTEVLKPNSKKVIKKHINAKHPMAHQVVSPKPEDHPTSKRAASAEKPAAATPEATVRDVNDVTSTASTGAKPPAAVEMPADFCGNIADIAAETRAKVRADQLAALEADLRTRISELEAKKAEVQSWVERQEDLRKRADETVLAILSKMKAESAAAQIALMDDATAAAVLMKLGPKVASSILNDMGATKAARITESMMAARVDSRSDGAKSAN